MTGTFLSLPIYFRRKTLGNLSCTFSVVAYEKIERWCIRFCPHPILSHISFKFTDYTAFGARKPALKIYYLFNAICTYFLVGIIAFEKCPSRNHYPHSRRQWIIRKLLWIFVFFLFFCSLSSRNLRALRIAPRRIH